MTVRVNMPFRFRVVWRILFCCVSRVLGLGRNGRSVKRQLEPEWHRVGFKTKQVRGFIGAVRGGGDSAIRRGGGGLGGVYRFQDQAGGGLTARVRESARGISVYPIRIAIAIAISLHNQDDIYHCRKRRLWKDLVESRAFLRRTGCCSHPSGCRRTRIRKTLSPLCQLSRS